MPARGICSGHPLPPMAGIAGHHLEYVAACLPEEDALVTLGQVFVEGFVPGAVDLVDDVVPFQEQGIGSAPGLYFNFSVLVS